MNSDSLMIIYHDRLPVRWNFAPSDKFHWSPVHLFILLLFSSSGKSEKDTLWFSKEVLEERETNFKENWKTLMKFGRMRGDFSNVHWNITGIYHWFISLIRFKIHLHVDSPYRRTSCINAMVQTLYYRACLRHWNRRMMLIGSRSLDEKPRNPSRHGRWLVSTLVHSARWPACLLL